MIAAPETVLVFVLAQKYSDSKILFLPLELSPKIGYLEEYTRFQLGLTILFIRQKIIFVYVSKCVH